MKYEEQKFIIPELKGMSKKSIEEHLKLYAGYVKNTNLIFEKMDELMKDSEKNAYILSELQRRFSFEFNGMRNHEYYFRSLEGGAKPLEDATELKKAIMDQFGSFESWLAIFKGIAAMRGIGWAILSYDSHSKKLINGWVEEQHIGQLNGLQYIVGIDMWEHSYVFDYQPSGKKQYIDDFMENINWDIAKTNYAEATETK